MKRAKRRVSNENGSDTELTFIPSGPMMCTIIRRNRYDSLPKRQDLTRRQTEILQALRNHQTNKEIGINLNISERTVKHHVGILLKKFGVDSRHKLVQQTKGTNDQLNIGENISSKAAASQ